MNAVSQEILGTTISGLLSAPGQRRGDEALFREVRHAHWERLDDGWQMSPGDAPVVRLTIRAHSFCHNMVRCLVSTIVAIGQGKIDQNTVTERLESRNATICPRRLPRGLCLVGVGYPQFAQEAPDFVG